MCNGQGTREDLLSTLSFLACNGISELLTGKGNHDICVDWLWPQRPFVFLMTVFDFHLVGISDVRLEGPSWGIFDANRSCVLRSGWM